MGSIPSQVLESLKGHLDFTSHGLSDKSVNAHNPEMIVLHCNDAGVNSPIITGRELGRQFVLRNISGAIPPSHVEDHDIMASLNYPLFNKKTIKSIMIMGHTNCGGIAGLVDAILDDISPNQSDTIRWMTSLETNGLVAAVKYADAHGATRKEIAAEVEKIMPILSCLRLLEYTSIHDGKEYRLSDIIREKGITLIPALYHVERDKSDQDAGKLFLFDGKEYKSLDRMLRNTKPNQVVTGSSSCTGGVLKSKQTALAH